MAAQNGNKVIPGPTRYAVSYVQDITPHSICLSYQLLKKLPWRWQILQDSNKKDKAEKKAG